MEATNPIRLKSKILQLLRVKPEESKLVFLVFLFAFFVGIVQNILCSIPLAMFLAHYESSLLPYMYIGSGIALFVAGFAFSYLERKVTLFYVFAIPIGLFAVSLCLFWGALLVVEADWIFLVLLIWSTLACFLMITILMLLTSQLFTTQQSKRLFGLIWCGADMRSNAEELLMQTLSSVDQKLLLSQLSFHPEKEKKIETPGVEQLEPFLVQVIERAELYFIPAMAAAATYTIGLLQLKNLAALVEKQEVKNDPLMGEMRPWALRQLE